MIQIMKHCRLFTFLGLLAFASTASADVLLNYDFTGSPGNQAFEAPDFAALGIVGGNLARGGTIAPSSGANSINSNGFETGNTRTSFYEFSVGLSGPGPMTLETLSFSERRSATGIRLIEVATSTDGVIFNTQAFINVPDNTADRDQTVTLTGLSNVTSPVIFRIFGSNSEGFGGTWRLQNNTSTGGLTVEGTVAIPEPGVVGLGMLVGCIGLLRRRQRW